MELSAHSAPGMRRNALPPVTELDDGRVHAGSNCSIDGRPLLFVGNFAHGKTCSSASKTSRAHSRSRCLHGLR